MSRGAHVGTPGLRQRRVEQVESISHFPFSIFHFSFVIGGFNLQVLQIVIGEFNLQVQQRRRK